MRTPEQRQTRINCEQLARVDRLHTTAMDLAVNAQGIRHSGAVLTYLARKRYALIALHARVRFGGVLFTGR